jgi:hypothetical protein
MTAHHKGHCLHHLDLIVLHGTLRQKVLNIIVDAKDEQRGGRAEHWTGDTVMTAPTAILVLDGRLSGCL